MSSSARLLNRPRFIEIVALTDDISDLCGEIADALAEYENADDYPSDERAGVRQEQRDVTIAHLENLLSNARALQSIYDRFVEDER